MGLEADLLLEPWDVEVSAVILVGIPLIPCQERTPCAVVALLRIGVAEVEPTVVFQEDVLLSLEDAAELATLVLPVFRMIGLGSSVGRDFDSGGFSLAASPRFIMVALNVKPKAGGSSNHRIVTLLVQRDRLGVHDVASGFAAA